MRSGHYNHQAHARQQAEFFARVEAERAAARREDGTMDYSADPPLYPQKKVIRVREIEEFKFRMYLSCGHTRTMNAHHYGPDALLGLVMGCKTCVE